MGSDERAQRLLIDALLVRGWRVDDDLVVAPHATIWLSHVRPWDRDLDDMIAQMRGRLERSLRHASRPDASEAWHDTVADTRSLLDALVSVVQTIETT